MSRALTKDDVLKIYAMVDENKLNQGQIGKKFGVSRSCVSHVVSGENWRKLFKQQKRVKINRSGLHMQLPRYQKLMSVLNKGKDGIQGEDNVLHKLTEKQVLEARELHERYGWGKRRLATYFGRGVTTMYHCAIKKNTWKYLNV